MKKNNTVSIIIPTYNHENYIEESIESALDQSFRNTNVIVADAGSSDNTIDKIQRFKKHIKLIKLNNSDPSKTINAAIKLSNSDMIALSSGDDVCELDRVSEQIEFASLHSLDALFTAQEIIDDQGNIKKNKIFPNLETTEQLNNKTTFTKLFYEGNYFCAPTLIIKREKLMSIGLFDERFFQLQDYELWLRMTLSSAKIGYLNKKLCLYRRHKNNISNQSKDIKVMHEIPPVLYKALSQTKVDYHSIFSKIIEKSDRKLLKLSEYDKQRILISHPNNWVRLFGKWKFIESANENLVLPYGPRNFNKAKYINEII